MSEFNSCASLMDHKDFESIAKRAVDTPNQLQDMLDTQRWLQGVLADKLPEFNIHPDDITEKGQLIKWLDGNFDAIMDEFRELKTSVGGMSNGEKGASAVWKKWKSNHGEMIKEKLDDMSEDDKVEMKMELIDIWHFVLNMFIGMGMTADDIYVLYMLKNWENARRYNSGY